MLISLLLLEEAPEEQNTPLSDRLLLLTFQFDVFSTFFGMTMAGWGKLRGLLTWFHSAH